MQAVGRRTATVPRAVSKGTIDSDEPAAFAALALAQARGGRTLVVHSLRRQQLEGAAPAVLAAVRTALGQAAVAVAAAGEPGCRLQDVRHRIARRTTRP
eukprot:4779458-Prymnesium_polylepis.1